MTLKLGTVVELPVDRSFYGVVTDPEVYELSLPEAGSGDTLVTWTKKSAPDTTYLYWDFEEDLEVVDTP